MTQVLDLSAPPFVARSAASLPEQARPRARWNEFVGFLRNNPDRAFTVSAAIYLAFCAVSFFIIHTTTQSYFVDYWEHRAIIGEIARGGPYQIDPIYGEHASSRQYTPWSLALGLLASWSGLSVDTALALGAMLVSIVFVFGVRAFARAFYGDALAPAVLLIALLCAWGLPALIWTGFHSFRSQIHSNYYPASLVFALTFFAWASTLHLLRGRGLNALHAIALAAIVACSVITHPLNAVLLAAGSIGLVVLEPGVTLARRATVAGLVAAGFLSTVLWPYFDPLSLAGAGLARGQATFNNFSFFYNPFFVVAQAWPAMLALFAVPAFMRDRAMWMPLIGFAGIFAAYVIGAVADVSVAHRLVAFFILMLQLLLTKVLLDAIDGRPVPFWERLTARAKRGVRIVMMVLLVIQVVSVADQFAWPWALAGQGHVARDVDAETTRVAATLPRDARVMGFDSAALVLPTYGVRVAAFPRPMPLSPSDADRQRDYRRFFARTASTCERLTIAQRWHVTHIAYLNFELRRSVQRQLAALGPAVSPVGPWRVIPVPSPGSVGC